ncbi:MAG: ABC transporter ATP-binding protein [Desulfatiglandaceae bacterium]|jgi:branched-chain amino acid transport system ATP-binding protein
MLRVESLEKSFDGFRAVNGAGLVVKEHEIVAVIGPNGAGKTTLFKLITGHLKPNNGRIVFKGNDITGQAPHAICKKGISMSFQVVNLFHRLTVFQNVQVAVLSHQNKTRMLFSPAANQSVRETKEILDNVGLADKADRIGGSLSHGDRKVLEIAVALGNYPDLLIMDEPTAGLSPEETAGTIDLIKRLSSELGLTILFCEHDMELVFSIAHRIMVMHQGRSLIEAEPNEVKINRQVQEAYLGVSD